MSWTRNETFTPGWDAGARSVVTLEGDGGFTWALGPAVSNTVLIEGLWLHELKNGGAGPSCSEEDIFLDFDNSIFVPDESSPFFDAEKLTVAPNVGDWVEFDTDRNPADGSPTPALLETEGTTMGHSSYEEIEPGVYRYRFDNITTNYLRAPIVISCNEAGINSFRVTIFDIRTSKGGISGPQGAPLCGWTGIFSPLH